MTKRHFLIAILLSLPAIAAMLALAEVMDAPWMRLVAVALIVETAVSRELMLWWGAGREWLVWNGTLLGGTIAMAAIAQLIAG